MKSNTTLYILDSVRSRILSAAKAAGRRECLGLLARRPHQEAVTAMLTLPAEATAASATAEPMAVKHAADKLAGDGLVPAGLWHSHATFGVFHSSTDRETLRRLMPAMASWSYERPVSRLQGPTVLGPDTAVLPTPDGFAWVFTLLGEPVPGTSDHLRTEWAEVRTRFGAAREPHQARFEDGLLVLDGVEASLRLRLPVGGSIRVTREETSLYKVSRLHSLVVNRRGDECVDCVTVHNCRGSFVLDQQPSSLVVVEDPQKVTVEWSDPGPPQPLALAAAPAGLSWAEACL